MVSPENARAVADLAEGLILATVEVAAPPDVVFHALTSDAVTQWWVNPGVFDTREWSADTRVGGAWRASGVGRGKPYVLEGEFLEVDAPKKLVHTWRPAGAPASASTTVTYVVEPAGDQTRVTLRHTGFASRDTCLATCVGWETSFSELSRVISSAGPGS
jgi:uncharacterized protein YndB with AHSA1/START domain